IKPGNRGREPCQGFRDQAAAAAHVEQPQALQWPQTPGRLSEVGHELVAQKAQSGGPDLVQWAELTAAVPPLGGQRREAVALDRVEGGARHVGWHWHGGIGALLARRVKSEWLNRWQTIPVCRP